MNNESLTTPLDGKELNTQLSSSASAWNITVGMPLSFTKSKPAVQKVAAPQKPMPAVQKVVEQPKQTPAAAPAEKPKKRCGYYQKRCGRTM